MIVWTIIKGLLKGAFGAILPNLPSLASFGTAIAAFFAAIPATLEAIGKILKTIGESPVLSLLFGASVAGAIAFLYGLSFDAPLRAKYRTQAINAANEQARIAIAAAVEKANKRADDAIAKAKADFDRKLAARKTR